jgi:hypothetical protein
MAEFQRSSGRIERIVFQPAAMLTVAIRALKKLRIFAGFNNLSTDGHGFQISAFRILAFIFSHQA